MSQLREHNIEDELSAVRILEACVRQPVSDMSWSDESLVDKVALSKVRNLTPITVKRDLLN